MARILILMYHIVDEPRSDKEAKFCCTPSQFQRQMEYLSKSSYQLLDLEGISEIICGTRYLDSDGLAVTFDDGFSDFHEHALPILDKWRIPATLFMVSRRIGRTNDWMHKRGFPQRDLLTRQQLLDVNDAGVIIGSHTRTHARLSDISSDMANLKEELESSKKELEDTLGNSIDHFAYPYGLFDMATIDAVREAGYRTACSTRSGFNHMNIDPLLLRRIEVYGNDRLWHFKQKLKFGTNDMSYTFPAKYYFSRLRQRLS